MQPSFYKRWLVFIKTNRAHVSISYHWLPVTACIKLKALLVAEQPQDSHPPASTCSYTVWISIEHHLMVSLQRDTILKKYKFYRTFVFTVYSVNFIPSLFWLLFFICEWLELCITNTSFASLRLIPCCIPHL